MNDDSEKISTEEPVKTEVLTEDAPKFGPLLKTLRKASGMKASEVAPLIGMHTNSQSNYENSKRDPGIDYLASFSCILGVPFWELMAYRIETGTAPAEYKRMILDQIGPFHQYLLERGEIYQRMHPDAADAPQQQGVAQQLAATCYDLMERYKGNDSLKIFKQAGNSMSPTITDQDTLFVDSSLRTPTEGEIFVFKIAGEYSAKRVQLLPGGGIMLTADNPNYHPVNTDKNSIPDLEIQGRLLTSITHHTHPA